MVDMTDIVTCLRKTDAVHEASEANDLMSAAADEITRLNGVVATMGEALEAVDRFSLVIESAVRFSDAKHDDAVLAMLLTVRAALKAARGEG